MKIECHNFLIAELWYHLLQIFHLVYNDIIHSFHAFWVVQYKDFIFFFVLQMIRGIIT